MNDTLQSPAEAGGDAQSPKSGDGPSRSAEQSAERPSLFERLTGLFRYRNGSSLREDIADALAETAADGAEAFSPGERAMLNNILRLREMRVEDAMIPRGDIKAVEITATLDELLVQFEEGGHSRMPVYSGNLDDARGMVHMKDVLSLITRQSIAKKRRSSRKAAVNVDIAVVPPSPPTGGLNLGNVNLTKTIGDLNLIRPVLFVPPSMLASDLMGRMQAERVQMALVVDEYGGTDGLVSLEDLVEMVVGDIEDEHDEDENLITKLGDGVFVVDARADIDEVAEQIGEAFSAGEHGESVDTISGLVFNALGRVPARGEVFQPIPDFEFQVLDSDPRRVKRVKIIQQNRPTLGEGADPEPSLSAG